MNTAYLGLGSNIYPRMHYLYLALNKIESDVGIIEKISSVYKTKPWKMSENTPFFYNMCVRVKTTYSPQMVLQKIIEIEKCLGRIKKSTFPNQYESRTIDIDILLYNDEIINELNLIVPHPFLHEREFVLLPLREIAGDVMHPAFNKRIKDL